MLNPQVLDDQLSVAAQLQPADMAAVAQMGFRAILNNRPDGEAPDQPTAADLAIAAARHGLRHVHQPVQLATLGPADVLAFRTHLQALPAPVLGFCRTGTRTTTLWALAQSGRLPPEQVLARARTAGYDLESLRPRLQPAVDSRPRP